MERMHRGLLLAAGVKRLVDTGQLDRDAGAVISSVAVHSRSPLLSLPVFHIVVTDIVIRGG
jgi:hypothetical protein